jgi:hypothetical protein
MSLLGLYRSLCIGHDEISGAVGFNPSTCTGYRNRQRKLETGKLIKSYVRSTMGENRLSGLALSAIERQFASEVDYNEVIDTFAKMKPRRKRLL